MKKTEQKLKRQSPYFSSDEIGFYIIKRTICSEQKNNFHWHDYCEMEFVVDGEGTHIIDGISCPIQKGSAFMLTPASFHAVTCNEKTPLTLYHLEFDNSIFENKMLQPVIAQFTEKETEELLMLFQMLEQEFSSNKKYCLEVIQALVKQLFFRLLRNSVTLSKETIKAPYIGKMIHQIHYGFREKLTLQELAEEYNLNPNYLGELFKKTMGISFHEYVQNLRLRYAHALLLNSDLSINEVCFESGFSTPSYFIKVFKECYGKTPSGLRNKRK